MGSLTNILMKCIHFIPPAISLILVGVWLLPQRRSMAALECECARLRSSIAVAEVPSTTTSDSLKIDRKSIDWARLGGQFQSNPELSSGTLTFGLIPDQRDAMRANQCMEAMSIAEIITTLEEIAALELSPKIRENLEWTLLDCMARKDPAAALELLESRGMMKSSLYQHLISKTLMVWAHKDCATAGDWFDKQISAGAFRSKALDGVDSSRYSFETILIRNLLRLLAVSVRCQKTNVVTL
jgi:hypothetical protein